MDESVQIVWTFNEEKDYMFEGDGPSLNNARSNHACSIFRSEAHDGNPVIVVAGGKSPNMVLYSSVLHIFKKCLILGEKHWTKPEK